MNPAIRLKVLPTFPASVTGANGITATLGGSTYTIAIPAQLTLFDGAVGTPSYSFASDTNTGMYRPQADVIGFSLGGVLGMNLSTSLLTVLGGGTFGGALTASSVTISGISKVGDGSAAAPSYTFTNDTASGLYRAANQVNVAVGGTLRATFDNTGFLTVTGGLVAPLVIGGSGGGATLTIESTSGAGGTTDAVNVKTGSQVLTGIFTSAGASGGPSLALGNAVTGRTAGGTTVSARLDVQGVANIGAANASLYFQTTNGTSTSWIAQNQDSGKTFRFFENTGAGGSETLTLYPSGGVSISGNAPVDAGKGNLYVQGGKAGIGVTPSHSVDIVAGTTSVAPMRMASGSLLTSATVGCHEYDGTGFYLTPSATSGRSIITSELHISQTADYTLTDNNTAQKAFNSSTNGTITVPGSTSYEFEALYVINTGINSLAHNWSTLFAGTATFTSIMYSIIAHQDTATTPSTSNNQIGYAIVATAVQATTTLSFPAGLNNVIVLRGIMRVNAGGTIIPQVKLSAAASGTHKMLTNSFFRMWPIGSNTVATVGAWS